MFKKTFFNVSVLEKVSLFSSVFKTISERPIGIFLSAIIKLVIEFLFINKTVHSFDFTLILKDLYFE